MTRIADGHWTEVRSVDSVKRQQLATKAAGRAKQRVINAHRSEYEHYLAIERKKLGLR